MGSGPEKGGLKKKKKRKPKVKTTFRNPVTYDEARQHIVWILQISFQNLSKIPSCVIIPYREFCKINPFINQGQLNQVCSSSLHYY